jgi:hypothetical protein
MTQEFDVIVSEYCESNCTTHANVSHPLSLVLLGFGNNTNAGAADYDYVNDDGSVDSLLPTMASVDGDGAKQGDGGLDMRVEVFNTSDGLNVVLANFSTTSSGHVVVDNVTDSDRLFSNYNHFTIYCLSLFVFALKLHFSPFLLFDL